MPQLIVIAVILSIFDGHVNDFLDQIKKHILKKIHDWWTYSIFMKKESRNIHSKIRWHHELIFKYTIYCTV